MDHQLADPVTSGGRQDGHEAVHLAVKLNFIEDFPTIGLHAAVMVVQPDAGQHGSTIQLNSREGGPCARDRGELVSNR